MARPQRENGFTGVAHEILEEVSKRKFNATQLSILLIVWRMTYGFNRKDHELAVNFFVKHTGFSKRNIQESLHTLMESNVLEETQKATFNQTRKIAFNKNYDEWLITSRAKGVQVNYSSPDEQKVTSTGDESNTSTGDESFTQERKKENFKENTVQSLLSEIETKDTLSGKAGVIVSYLNKKFPDRKRFGTSGNIKANDVFTKHLQEGLPVERILKVIDESEVELAPWDIVKMAKEIKTDSLAQAERLRYLWDTYYLGEDYYKDFGNIDEFNEAVKELKAIGQL